MIASPSVELATVADMPALLALRLAQNWHPNAAVLRAVLEWEHGRVFVVREEGSRGAPLAATSAIAGGATGVIGNVVVREDARRRGLGRLLMETALDWMREHGARVALLDATVDGRPLYTRLGFQPVERSWFCASPVDAFDRKALGQHAAGIRARLLPATRLDAIGALDAQAFGGDRLGLLQHVIAQMPCWLYAVEEQGGIRGYLLARCPGERPGELRLGPWIAEAPRYAAALLVAALGEAAPWRAVARTQPTGERPHVLISLPGTNTEALTLLSAVGAEPAVDDLIMRLDLSGDSATRDASTLSHPEWIYGWLSNMAF